MNRIAMSVLLLVAAATLPGCASPARAVSDETDQAKIDRVERAALTTGAQVRWVNPPKKPAAAPGS